MATGTPHNQDLVLSGGLGSCAVATRAGYLPIAVDHVPMTELKGIDIYVKTHAGPDIPESFTLFRSGGTKFTDNHRKRLEESGLKFIYIPIAQHMEFQKQAEANLLARAADPNMAASAKAELIYRTSVELVNELLDQPDQVIRSNRLFTVSKATAIMVLNDATAFSHLFAASDHDFYTATHMVNVATWMVPLACAMGYNDPDLLGRICAAGLVHDIGKIQIATEILNKQERLSASEWTQIKRHPQNGAEYLAQFENIDPLIMDVTLHHHERMDGSGYPHGLKGEQIHPFSRICGIVDSFDAMTAFRPYKGRTLSVSQAMQIITSESAEKYDPKIVDGWVNLVRQTEAGAEPANNGEQYTESDLEPAPLNCPARISILELHMNHWRERAPMKVVAHNLSPTGISLLAPKPITPGEHVRVHLQDESHTTQPCDGVIVRCRRYDDGWFELGIKRSSPAETGYTHHAPALAAP